MINGSKNQESTTVLNMYAPINWLQNAWSTDRSEKRKRNLQL